MPTIEKRPDEPKPKQRNKKDDPLIKRWKNRISLAEKNLREVGGDVKNGGKWKDFIKLYEGDQWRGAPNPRKWHRITSNLIKANIDSLRPQLYFQNPKVNIELKNPYVAPQDIPLKELVPNQFGELEEVDVMQQAVDPQTGQPVEVPVIKFPKGTPLAKIGDEWVNAEEQIELIESIDNYYLEEMGAKMRTRRMINDALVLPYAVSKLEWVVVTEDQEEPDPEGGTIKRKDQIVDQFPRYSRVKPWCFIFDPELDELDLEQARWVAEIKWMSREDLENDQNLDQNEVKKLGKPPHILDGIDTTFEMDEQTKEDVRRYKVFEIHDLENEKLMVLVEGHDMWLRFEDNPYAMVEGSVYTIFGFDEDIDSPFPISIPEQLQSKQEAYNFILSYQMNHVRRFNRVAKIRKGSMDDDEKTKMEEGPDGTIVEMEDMNSGPEPIEFGNITPDIYNVQGILKREITEEIGVSAYNRASREAGVDTAFEANLIQGGADIKVQEKRDVVREYMRRVVKKLNQILKVYMDTEQAVKITGAKGTKWRKWSREDIQGEFIEDVDIYSSMPFSKMEERKQAMEMFSLVQQDPYFDPFQVRNQLRKAMDWSEKVLLTPAEVEAKMAQQNQTEMQALQENNAQSASDYRPSEGDIERRSDMIGAMQGGRTY